MNRRFGRLVVPDERDHNYSMAALLPPARARRLSRFWWDSGWWGDQGETSECVAYAWTHWLADGPVLHSPRIPGQTQFKPEEIYHAAQKVDEVPGEGYEGTSVRAGARSRWKGSVVSAPRRTSSNIVSSLLISEPFRRRSNLAK